MNMKLTKLILSMACLAGAGALVYKYSAPEQNTNQIVVGIGTPYPPFEMLNEQGELIGFDVEVMAALSKKLGKKIEFKMMAFDYLILSLKQKKVDLIIAGITITPQRLKEIQLIPYQGAPLTTLSLVFWGTVPKIQKIEELAAYKNPVISVQTGTIAKDWISTFPFITIRQLDTNNDLVLNIKYGKSLACVLEPVVFEHLHKTYPELTKIDIPLPQDFTTYGYGIGISKDNAALAQQIEKAITELKKDGTIATLEKKWF